MNPKAHDGLHIYDGYNFCFAYTTDNPSFRSFVASNDLLSLEGWLAGYQRKMEIRDVLLIEKDTAGWKGSQRLGLIFHFSMYIQVSDSWSVVSKILFPTVESKGRRYS